MTLIWIKLWANYNERQQKWRELMTADLRTVLR